MADFYIKKGDRLPAISGYLVGSNNARPNCTGASIKLLARNRDTGTVVINAAAAFTDAVNAVWSYSWAVGDTAAAQDLVGELEVTFPSTLKQTFPNPGTFGIHVTEDIA